MPCRDGGPSDSEVICNLSNRLRESERTTDQYLDVIDKLESRIATLEKRNDKLARILCKLGRYIAIVEDGTLLLHLPKSARRWWAKHWEFDCSEGREWPIPPFPADTVKRYEADPRLSDRVYIKPVMP